MNFWRPVILLSSAVLSVKGIAQTAVPLVEKTAQVSSVTLGSGQHILTVLTGLVGIVVLILLVAWFARRFNGGSWLKASHIKIVSAMPLGARERLLLVQVGEQQLLLGITAQTISTLHALDKPVSITEGSTEPSDFSQKLLAMLNKQKVKPSSVCEIASRDH